MWSPICNASEYAEELQRCFGDALEKAWSSIHRSYSDSREGTEEQVVLDSSEWASEQALVNGLYSFESVPCMYIEHWLT